MTENKIYLGDGVYAEFDLAREIIILTTEDGVSITNTIYLEDFVLEALLKWLKRIGKIK